MIDEIKVGIADLNISSSPNKLITIGLGSCIGITIFDRIKKIGGLVHIMLPDSTQFTNVTNPAKFADLGIPSLMKKMEDYGASRRNFTAKIAGGASMFNFSDSSMTMDIGNRNTIAVKKALATYNIPILGEDTGGNKGRTMIFNISDGVVQIRTVGLGVKEI